MQTTFLQENYKLKNNLEVYPIRYVCRYMRMFFTNGINIADHIIL